MTYPPHPETAHPAESLDRADRRSRTTELFERLRQAPLGLEQDRIREQIATINMGVAESVAHRYRGRGENCDDLEQVAYLGLMKAVNGFDSSYHKDFLTYAVPTISGELKKHFRDHCWAVRPPRRIQELQTRIASAEQTLGQRLDGAPTIGDVADELDLDTEEVEEAMSADGCFTPASLDVPVGRAENESVSDLMGENDAEYERTETHVILADVVRELGERDRDIVKLRFFHDWTQDRIAQELGLTQMQVSRLLKRITKDLRERIG